MTYLKAFLAIILVVTVCGVLVGLLLLPVEVPHESTRRMMQCSTNLKQIGMAMHNYHEVYKCFPPAFIADKNGKPMHSWRVLLLPYLEEKALYAQYRFDEPWNGPHNMALAERVPAVYWCPTQPVSKSQTSYAMIVGPLAISDGPTARSTNNIKDGFANTIMVAEAADAGINWLEPRDLKTEKMTFNLAPPDSDTPSKKHNLSSCHPGVVNVLFCDGSVQSISNTIDPKLLKAMTTIDDGETTPPLD
jgi:prepilin-type processing-associated H-X9-DG protein